MSRQIPWARVLVEGVVIVTSMLMAFGIDAWWTETQERAEERVLLSGLIVALASPATSATLLNTRMSPGSASRSGAQLFEEAVALMRRIEVSLRPGGER